MFEEKQDIYLIVNFNVVEQKIEILTFPSILPERAEEPMDCIIGNVNLRKYIYEWMPNCKYSLLAELKMHAEDVYKKYGINIQVVEHGPFWALIHPRLKLDW